MKRILVPVDFSPTSERAFLFAADLASRTGGTIVLYHVYSTGSRGYLPGDVKEKSQPDEKELLLRLQRLSKKIANDYPQVVVSCVTGRTPVVDNILGFAEHHHIDLIVMGTQGGSGLNKVIIGSVAAQVIEEADIPVIIIPEKYELSVPEKIVYTTGYSPDDAQALRYLTNFANVYNASLTVVHLTSAYETETGRLHQDTKFAAYKVDMKNVVQDFPVEFRLIRTPLITSTMENLHREIPYDLMAMTRRNKSQVERFFTGSFTRNMAYVTRYPLLILPEQWD